MNPTIGYIQLGGRLSDLEQRQLSRFHETLRALSLFSLEVTGFGSVKLEPFLYVHLYPVFYTCAFLTCADSVLLKDNTPWYT